MLRLHAGSAGADYCGNRATQNVPANKPALACHHIFVLQNRIRPPCSLQLDHCLATAPTTLLARPAAAHRTLETAIAEATSDGEFRAVSAGIVIQLLTGSTNAAMDLGVPQPIDDIDQSAADYFAVFFAAWQELLSTKEFRDEFYRGAVQIAPNRLSYSPCRPQPAPPTAHFWRAGSRAVSDGR